MKLTRLQINRRNGIILSLLILISFTQNALASEDIALVAHPAVPVENLSFSEARKIFLGNRQYWSNDLRITLLIRAPIARERDIMLRTFYQMTEAQFRQYWISKIFRAEVTAGPKVVFSSEMALELIILIPGSITFVEASQIPKGLKLIKIDGRLPGEHGYPLH